MTLVDDDAQTRRRADAQTRRRSHSRYALRSIVRSFDRSFDRQVELLIRYLLVGPILALLVWIASKLDVFGWFAARVAESDIGSFYVNQATGARMSMNTERTTTETESPNASGTNRVLISRRTFDKEFPNALAVLRKFFRKVTLSEACFRDVVVIYRQNESSGQKSEFSLRSGMKEDVIQRNIVMKRFSSIPLADMELVFPETNVHFSPSTTVNIAVTIIGALATLFFSVRGGLSLTSAWTSFTVLAGRVVQVYQTAATQKTEIEKSMGDIVSRRTVATQNAALSSVMNDLFGQLTREVFMAYCLLAAEYFSANGRTDMTLADLDAHCESVLEREFETTVDFTCEQAVDILTMWRVVSVRSDGTLVPVAPKVAVKRLEKVLIVASTQSASMLGHMGQSVADGLAGVGGRIVDGVGTVGQVVGGLAREQVQALRAKSKFRTLFGKKK